jgi:hypothetical protein
MARVMQQEMAMDACCAPPSPAPRKSSRARKAVKYYAYDEVFSPCQAAEPPALSPRELLSEFDRQALSSTDFSAIIRQLENEEPGLDWRCALDDLVTNEGLDLETAWAVMLSWLADTLTRDLTLSRQAHRLLRRALSALDNSRQKSLRARIDSRFSSLKTGSRA